jgi:putative polyketide hydroxylase
MLALLAGYRYHSDAVVTNEAAPKDPDAVAVVDELRGQAGTRVPHVWVERGGERASTLDLLGPGFTVLTRDDDGAWPASAASAAAAVGVPLSVHRIGPRGDAVDTDGQWAGLTGLGPGGALLVRPDEFVGWRADKLPARPDHELRQALSTILSRG